MTPPEPVLLVEDNDDIRAALARLLDLRGYTVVEASDGQEALEYFREGGRASLIILDLFMPRLDGRTFRAIQMQHAELAHIPVIVFSVAEGETLPDVVGFVRKSATPDSLLSLVDRAAGGPVLIDQ